MDEYFRTWLWMDGCMDGLTDGQTDYSGVINTLFGRDILECMFRHSDIPLTSVKCKYRGAEETEREIRRQEQMGGMRFSLRENISVNWL